MPVGALIVWLVTGGLCFIVGFFLMWRIEKSEVKRWGASGSIFSLECKESDKNYGKEAKA